MRDVIFGAAVEEAFQEGSASDANLINSVALQQARAQRKPSSLEKTLFEQLVQPITEIITGLTLALSVLPPCSLRPAHSTLLGNTPIC